MGWAIIVVFVVVLASVIEGQASAPGTGGNPTGSGGKGGSGFLVGYTMGVLQSQNAVKTCL